MNMSSQGIRVRVRIMHCILTRQEEEGRPPTIREIRSDLGISSTGDISHHTTILVGEGHLRRLTGARNLQVTDQGRVWLAGEEERERAERSAPRKDSSDG